MTKTTKKRKTHTQKKKSVSACFGFGVSSVCCSALGFGAGLPGAPGTGSLDTRGKAVAISGPALELSEESRDEVRLILMRSLAGVCRAAGQHSLTKKTKH